MRRTPIHIAATILLLICTTASANGPWRISVSATGTQPSGGMVAQVAVAHTSVLGPLGLRVSAESGFGTVPVSVAAGIIDGGSWGPVDIYGGVGVGATFEPGNVLIFGELLLGASHGLTDSIGVFGEARYRPYFDGTATGLAGAAAGLQFRF